jgi:hypothetical protein
MAGPGTFVARYDGSNWKLVSSTRPNASREINLADFGAVGDGVADDTAALQAWADAGASQPGNIPALLFAPKPSVAYRTKKRILFRGANGGANHFRGEVGRSQYPVGTKFLFDGDGPDNDAIKQIFTASTGPQTHSYPGTLDGTGYGVGLQPDHPDPRHLTITLIGDPSDFFTDPANVYASYAGTDDLGNDVTTTTGELQINISKLNDPCHMFGPHAVVRASTGVNTTTGLFTTENAHDFAIGDAIVFFHPSGEHFEVGTSPNAGLPGGIFVPVTYYVLSDGFTATAFKISLTRGGAVLVPTSTGNTTFHVARAARTFRSFHRMKRITSVKLPAFPLAGPNSQIVIGWEGGTLFEFRGINSCLVENLEFDANASTDDEGNAVVKASYCAIMRWDPQTPTGASGNTFRNCSFLNYEGPMAAGVGIGQPNPGTGGIQADNTTFHNCFFQCRAGVASDDEAGVKMFVGDNVLDFGFYDCGFLYNKYAVDARFMGGPLVFIRCSFANNRYAALRCSGLHASMIENSREQNGFTSRIVQAIGGTGPTIRLIGGAHRIIAPTDDDIVLATTGTLIMLGTNVGNRRIPSVSVPRFQVDGCPADAAGTNGTIVSIGNNFSEAKPDSTLFLDGSQNDLRDSWAYAQSTNLNVVTFGDWALNTTGLTQRMPNTIGQTVRNNRTSLYVPEWAKLANHPHAALTFSASAKTIVRSTGSWITDNFAPGTYIEILNSASNNKSAALIATVTATTITLDATETLVNEGPVYGVTVQQAGISVSYSPSGIAKATVDYRYFKVASTFKFRRLMVLAAKTAVKRVMCDTTTAYDGPAGELKMQIGINGADVGGLIRLHDVKTAAVLKGLQDVDLGPYIENAAANPGNGYVHSWTSAFDLSVWLQSSSGNLSGLTAGQSAIIIDFEYLS